MEMARVSVPFFWILKFACARVRSFVHNSILSCFPTTLFSRSKFKVNNSKSGCFTETNFVRLFEYDARACVFRMS